MLSRRATRSLATSLLLTAAGVAVGLIWAVRRQPVSRPVQTAVVEPVRVRVVPPSRSSFDDEPELTAVPQGSSYSLACADDYESIAPDELSAAFLSRVTESSRESMASELDSNSELSGFQIASIEDLTVPELNDDPADFELPSAGLAERTRS